MNLLWERAMDVLLERPLVQSATNLERLLKSDDGEIAIRMLDILGTEILLAKRKSGISPFVQFVLNGSGLQKMVYSKDDNWETAKSQPVTAFHLFAEISAEVEEYDVFSTPRGLEDLALCLEGKLKKIAQQILNPEEEPE